MIDFTKPVQTRNGLPVRILCTDKKGGQPIIGLINEGMQETATSFSADGQYLPSISPGHRWDLQNVPERHKHADLIIAWANGATIQWFDKRPEHWATTSSPMWDNNHHYRIKPE